MSSSKHTKIKERLALSQRVLATGFEMPSCNRCEKKHLKCVVSDDSKCCSQCVRVNARCDACVPSISDWDKIEREEHCLQAEEEAAMAKILRLRQQQRLFCSRAKDMLCHGLKTMDKLDEAEEKERREAEAKGALLHTPPTTVSEDVAPDQDFFAVLSHGFFEHWGVDGEMPPAILDS
ncbi:hypothetical protein GMDG_01152 [Pseudogymnoascus destructans 20631-21]|uniref:Zn(2)-C6 fungal-type domain-containing protein n=1 Tax=Pseudogymnoascus destructans (strain ATCC MYA-4855 / 20631-21) TaxID=658429 RepID=L8FT83_PSED2|nr:hypothetical protein GMDG_01152 [Pseudogymnoascus destructans 20631-21]